MLIMEHLPWSAMIIILLMSFISLKNPTIKYYFSYTFFILMVAIACLLSTPFTLLRLKNPANMRMTYPFAYITSKVLGIKYELRGAEILAKEQAAVLVVNHQSAFDVLAHCRIMNVVKSCVIVSRKELKIFFPYYMFMSLAGSLFIDRKDGKTANETLLQVCPVLSKYKSKLLIYPEGTRNLNAKTLNQFKKGGFRVAITGQFPVIPIVISPFYYIDPVKKHFSSGHTIMKALEPISTNGLKMDDIDSLIEKTWKIMSDEYEKLRNEIYNENK
ncbi:1-acyl-sn-glycerol-3-phosphate acyltransferase alpha-like [Lycorma delicatula]|uniref:1-acyl-sn-glycerol-3-phosphate acyltransferase alpha-like n=1 Tax=Lycorma delicatula TaxID=130591 RepID=UPI003F518D27